MKKLAAVLVSVIAFACSIVAQVPVQVPLTGNIAYITGGQTPYAGVNIDLVNCPSPVTYSGYSVIVPTLIQLQSDGTGLVNSTIIPNDKIACNGTIGASQYALAYIVNGTPTADASCYQVTSSQTQFNLNVQLPITCGATPPTQTSPTFDNVLVNGTLSAYNLNLLGAFTWNSRFAQSFTNTISSPLTFTAPAFNQSISDSTTVNQFNSGTPADPYATPAYRIVSSDDGVNDTVPAFFWHNCNYTGATTSAPCVGMFAVSQNNLGDLHNGVWGANFLAMQYRSALNDLTYGVETNVFNMTGIDPGSPDNPTGGTSPIFGYAATMGGGASGANGTAAFYATDTNSGEYWWDGLYVLRAKYAAVEAGPISGGSALQYSLVSNPEGQAQAGTNYAAIPEQDIVSDWNGTGSYLETMTRQFVPDAGNSPENCYTYKFSTNVRFQFCDNGDAVINSVNGTTAIRETPGSDTDGGSAFEATNAANNKVLFYADKKGDGYFDGYLNTDGPISMGTTTFTVSGCTASSPIGTGTAGIFTLGANTCSVIVTLNGAIGMTATHGWTCNAHDRNNSSVAIRGESSSTTTTATFTIPSTATVNDVVSFDCHPY